jgi:hypothetical protein
MAKKVSNMRKARGGEDGVMGWIRHKVVRYPNPHDTHPLLDSALTVVFFALLGGWSAQPHPQPCCTASPQFQFDGVFGPHHESFTLDNFAYFSRPVFESCAYAKSLRLAIGVGAEAEDKCVNVMFGFHFWGI